ncbi:MAG: HTTM domain-containing protein, partial [Lewinella sp.]|nr:HTTM domain-containing protein [Lewinella sp.]
MLELLTKYQKVLDRPVDIASLVFFRIVFGVLALSDIAGTWLYYHLEKNAFDPQQFQFRYYGFEWVHPFPEPWISAIFISLILAAMGIIVGRWYRFFTIYFAVGYIYTFLLEKSNYLNHGYLFCWLAVIMIFLPADRQWSWAVWKHPAQRRDIIPFRSLFVLRFLIGVVYFFGGVAKINGDWLRGVPLVDWMAYKSSLPVIGPVLGMSWTPYFMAYVGVMLDLTVAFFLLNRRIRPWAFALVICFHLLNMLIFNIGIFPYLSVALTALYFPPDFPRKMIAKLSGRWKIIQKWVDKWENRMLKYPITSSQSAVSPAPAYLP